MNINKSFQILEALYFLQKKNLTKEEFNAKYSNIEYEKILSLKEKIKKDKDIEYMIIKFHNEDILVDFIEKVNIEKLPYDFSDLTNIHNKEYFDILSEIKDYELFFEVYKNIEFKRFDSIDKGTLIDIFNTNISEYNLDSKIYKIKQLSTTEDDFIKNISNILYKEEDNFDKAYKSNSRLMQCSKIIDNNIRYKNTNEEIKQFIIEDLQLGSLTNKVKIIIEEINQEQERYKKIDELGEQIKKLDQKILKIILNPDFKFNYLDESIIEKFLSISKEDILTKVFPNSDNKKKEDIIFYVNELWIKEIKPDIDNEKLSILKNYKDLYKIKDFLREKLLELDYKILNIILNPDFNFNYLDKSIIEKFLSISKEDILTKVFPDPNNRKKEDIIFYVNELWIKEISPDINDEKLNILKNYKYLYTLKDCLNDIVNLSENRLKKLFSNTSLNYQHVFMDNKDLLRYYIFELDIKNILNTGNIHNIYKLSIIRKLNTDSGLDLKLNKKILKNLNKFDNIDTNILDLLKELIQFPDLADKFLDLDKDLIEKYVFVFSETLFYDGLIKRINEEQKNPLNIFMKKYYLFDLLLSSKELLNSFNTKYKEDQEECLKQLSNIGDLLIDFKPKNKKLFNALQEFLPNLSEDEFNKCELVDQLFDFISGKSLESTEYPNSKRFKIGDKEIPSINKLKNIN